jgi:hypothetical protein
MKSAKIIFFVCIFSIAATVFGQKNLEKPYQKWTKEEASKTLSSSPWTQQYRLSGDLPEAAEQQLRRDQSSVSERVTPAYNLDTAPLQIRLHSALPVRQALVRLRQIQNEYDKMSDDQKKKFDDSTSILLNCAICADYYVVTMMKLKTASKDVADGLFQQMKVEDFKGKVWLANDKGERRELAQFTPAKGAGDMSIFFFKRTDDSGKALITHENKEFKVVFDKSLRDGHILHIPILPPSLEFNVSKITIDGKIEF